MKTIGKILWWDSRDREGVIVNSSGAEFYFNASVFPTYQKAKNIEGRFVEFEKNATVTHISCAKKVSLLPTNSESKAKKSFEKQRRTASTDVDAA